MLRIAITGANGFIGRNLIADCERAGVATVPVSRKRLHVANWRVSPDLEQNSDPADWARAFAGVRAVVHSAGRAHVMKERAPDPLAIFRRINRDGTIAMARGAALAGVRRIVFLSSVKVLGATTSERAPFENDAPPAPTDPYSISKAEAEAALRELSHECGFELVVLRLPLVYGPGVGGNMANLLKLIRRGYWLPLGGVSGNRRSMISTGNLSDAILASLTASDAVGGRLLVSDGHDLSTRDLIRGLATAAGRSPRLVSVPSWVLRGLLTAAGGEALWSRLCGDLQLDITATCERLSWQPRLSVAEGLATMVSPTATGSVG